MRTAPGRRAPVQQCGQPWPRTRMSAWSIGRRSR